MSKQFFPVVKEEKVALEPSLQYIESHDAVLKKLLSLQFENAPISEIMIEPNAYLMDTENILKLKMA